MTTPAAALELMLSRDDPHGMQRHLFLQSMDGDSTRANFVYDPLVGLPLRFGNDPTQGLEKGSFLVRVHQGGSCFRFPYVTEVFAHGDFRSQTTLLPKAARNLVMIAEGYNAVNMHERYGPKPTVKLRER